LQATIYRSTGSWYTAKTETGEIYKARIKGLLKRDGDITSTNPIAVGDIVEIVVEEGDANAKNAMITEIGARRNYIVRSSPHRKNQKHIGASNLDQAMLICTLKEPRTSNGFMDRFLVTAAAYHIPVTLVFNKKDIYGEKEIDRFAELAAVYEDIGYTVCLVSATTGEGVDELVASMENKTTLMSGHSGVGKSSLINMLTNIRKLAKISVTPGKTQTINHYLINESWYLVDLPGYGYASVSKSTREGFGKMIEDYVLKRENLYCLFILIDSRLEPQKIDLAFIEWAGDKEIPIGLIFTKTDKLKANELQRNIAQYKRTLLTRWEELPPTFLTSSEKKLGRDELLDFMDSTMRNNVMKASGN
jgi:ribosome biogenesis GTPase